ncbi:MAG: hypothetical protein COS35_06520 [Zetaproteobacteria bacterium CG02_land_8_20_14_3_00_50_9]|nr:MAG: hypothetical protein AUJ57_07745 [Zetaproteobacteria bacterium CG1_02_53_45]PIV30493.1 MAG: hypothetical protein COS35_06520 [Zetaproteobacteria bacterium CG02_land_8_20_14_3_00_50_9]
MALTKDANTPERDGALVSAPVAAATIIYAGSMVALNAAGNAVPAADTAALKVLGRAESQVNNAAGAAGDLKVTVKRGTFRFKNSGTAALAAGDELTNALVEDDGTVAKTSTNSIVAGKIIEIDASGVWVEIK